MAPSNLLALYACEGRDLLHDGCGGVISQVQLRKQAGAALLDAEAGNSGGASVFPGCFIINRRRKIIANA
eukprot:CAMPEP_0171617948 /NCGR_PEP_ID=MMETSP0990-20121206/14431_1 /TAXON_ID=483369 /ORGANISM="non described non described, Strain CCMP2098" /LENGTH=69 /DNA_ID=CAMNT_0012182611 /DNA_START=194 /DNA_END=404 /DNA_ORIENTATION=-